LAAWVLSQSPGIHLYVHNCIVTPAGPAKIGDPSICIMHEGEVYPVGVPIKGQRRERKRKAHKNTEPTGIDFGDKWLLGDVVAPGVSPLGGSLSKVDKRYFGFENATPELFAYSDMWEGVDASKSKFMVWLRDPIDNLASLVTHAAKQPPRQEKRGDGQNHVPGQLIPDRDDALFGSIDDAEHELIDVIGSSGLLPTRFFPFSWHSLATAWSAEYPEGFDVVKLRYDLWARDEDYRRAKAGELGIEFTDAGFDNVPLAGGGSSVSGIEQGKANEIRSRSRGRQLYADDDSFKRYVDAYLIPRIGEAYEIAFGKPLDPTEA
jgi:hypothetical protein